MRKPVSKVTIHPPPGAPSWGGPENLPLIYLGWGRRDFAKNPLPVHFDRGTNYFILARGEIILSLDGKRIAAKGPAALFVDSDCPFGITQSQREKVEILVWVWKGRPGLPELQLSEGGHLLLDLKASALDALKELHTRCRKEIAVSDSVLPSSLGALRQLLEVEILRATRPSAATGDLRWELARSWMMNNLSIHTPVPALCDYLGMSPSALHRFFQSQIGQSPGAYFRQLKWQEAKRLVDVEGWQVKAAAYHLGYRHPNDLSRALKANDGDVKNQGETDEAVRR